MKKLTLIRHAKSDWSDIGLQDFDRPLNKRGKKAAPMMAARMRDERNQPQLIISSPAKRARKTARLMADELNHPKEKIHFNEDIYDAWVDTLIDLIRDLPNEKHIALIGHNPGMSELGQWLCADAPEWLPTCAVLSLDLDIDSWRKAEEGCGRIRSYDYPKKTQQKGEIA